MILFMISLSTLSKRHLRTAVQPQKLALPKERRNPYLLHQMKRTILQYHVRCLPSMNSRKTMVILEADLQPVSLSCLV
ncbi:unnamed protein product [Nezara viridula]|uniref:Uncharacterized protein n=1 Tax=Nezara viridula TaxID=85310 RepID=A0A9P0GZQ1_NEZVI|nr:unnamed protein product [Nezara viridula]